eukprot:TRINITY_DN1911_c2_g1_i1.p1 TRINITY_DN1911_c2_g1~~TRINITY_DN1911_c2_g1_i1.p1  ORF type:complete len:408 (+),score=88.98 TRINITY_DN1911_c2_g1_i1:78-1226(+)
MRVGKYELGKTVGRGAFSKVKVAVHMETDEEYVLKIIDKRSSSGDKQRKNVEQEVRLEISIMKLLDHVNIVRMYEVMESSKHYYIVLESVRGGDLCDHIMSAGKLSEEQGKKYFANLCTGLSACHQAGVAHRDIKPENCLISVDGVLKVADFGLSRLHRGRGEISDPSDLSTDAVGTLSYAAPEVLGGPYNAFKADLWSIGVVVFVMCTGKFPFGSKGYTESQIQQDIKKGKINKFPQHLTPEIKDLITSVIIVEPAKRLSLDELLKHPWTGEHAVDDKQQQAGRKRPVPIDVDAVKQKAVDSVTEAVGDTMSPTWADSPIGAQHQKFIPGLLSPRQASPPCPSAEPSHSPKVVNDSSPASLNALKGMLEAEGRKINGKSGK